MATSREQFFAVAFSVVLLFSLFAAAGPAIAASANTDEPFDEASLADVEVQTQSIDDVYIDDQASAAVEQVDGDTSELYVRFDPEISEAGESVEVNSPDDLRVEAETTQAPFAKFAQETAGVEVAQSFWLDNAMLIEIDPEETTIADIAEIDGVTEIHPNYEVESPEPVAGPKDAHISSTESTTYGLDQVNAPSVWEDFDATGEGVTVAVVDTGVDPDHPEFESYDEDNWAAFGFSGEPLHEQDEEFSEPFDANAHGTHVSGTVLGGDASGESIGVAPNAELYAINVFPDPNSGTTLAAIVAGLEHAVDEDVDIANFSLGGSGFAAIYIDVVRNAMNAGTLIVSSSGNSGVDSTGTPGNIYDGIAAGATDESQQVARFSTGDRVNTTDDWGPIAPDDWPAEYKTPDVSAPGVLVTSSVPTDLAESAGLEEPYAEFSGTSMAAPHTTGVAALIMSETDRTPNETKELIQASATKPHPIDISSEVQTDAAVLDDTDALFDDNTRDVRYGYGIIDAYAAFQSIDDENVSTIEGTVTPENELSFVFANGTTQTLEADEPISGVPVSIDADGIRNTRTDEEGVYSFDVLNGSYDVSIADPIFQGSTSATVDGEDISDADIEVSPTTAADLANPQPEEIASGEPIELNLAMFEMDTYTVSLNESATATAEDIESVTIEYHNSTESKTIEANGSDLADGGVPVDFADAFNGEVVVTVETNDSAEAGTTIDLQHTFVGPDGEQFLVDGETPVTGPTELRGAQATSEPLTITAVDAPADEVVYTDEESTVEVTVENTGDFTEATEVTLGAVNGSLDPEAELVEPVSVAPDSSETVTFTVPWGAFAEDGDEVTHQIAVNGTPSILGGDGGDDETDEQTVTISDPGDVFGQVTDETGTAVAGASVTIIDDEKNEPVDTAETDFNGSYGALIPDEGSYTAIVEAPAHNSTTESFEVSDRDEDTQVDAEIDTLPNYEFTLEAGEPQAIGFPGPTDQTILDVVGEDTQGVVFGYNASAAQWEQVDVDESPDPLEAVVVVPAENTTATVEIADAETVPDVTQASVEPGFNFVTPPQYGTPSEAFAASTKNATPSLIINATQQADTAMVPSSEFDGAGSVSDIDETVAPFEGYFVFVDDNGTIGGPITEGVTRTEANDAFGFETTTLEGVVVGNATSEELPGPTEVEIAGGAYGPTTADPVFKFNHVPVDTPQPATVSGAENSFGTPNYLPTDTELTTDQFNEVRLDADKLFRIDSVSVSEDAVSTDGEFTVEYEVVNAGVESAEKTVQIQIGESGLAPTSDDAITVGIETIELEPGESRTVETTVSLADAALEPGEKDVLVFSDAAETFDDVGYAPIELFDPADVEDPSAELPEQAIDTRGDAPAELLLENVTVDEGDAIVVTERPVDGDYEGAPIVFADIAPERVVDDTVAINESDDPENISIEGGQDYAVHVINGTNVSEQTLDQQSVSAETLTNVESTDSAPVYNLTALRFEDDAYADPTDNVTVAAAEIRYDGELAESASFHIDLHNEADNGGPGAFVGVSVSDLAFNERHEDIQVDVLEPRAAGDDSERNESTIDESGVYFAMPHIGEAGTDANGDRIPAQNPPLLLPADDSLFPVVNPAEIAVGVDTTLVATAEGTSASHGGSSGTTAYSSSIGAVYDGPDAFELGGESEQEFRITNLDADASVVVTPDTNQTTETDVIGFRIYNGTGGFLSEPKLVYEPEPESGELEEINATVEPESGVNPFTQNFSATYEVALLSGGDTVNVSAPFTAVTNYTGEFEQNSTNGDIEVSVTRDNRLNDSWSVAYRDGRIDYLPQEDVTETEEKFSYTFNSTPIESSAEISSFQIYEGDNVTDVERFIISPFDDVVIERFNMSGLTQPIELNETEETTVTVDAENIGETSEAQNVTLAAAPQDSYLVDLDSGTFEYDEDDAIVLDTNATAALEPGENTTVEFTVNASDLPEGEYVVGAFPQSNATEYATFDELMVSAEDQESQETEQIGEIAIVG